MRWNNRTVKYAVLFVLALSVVGCGAADQAANEATQATVGSVDKAKETAAAESARVNAGEKTLEESESK